MYHCPQGRLDGFFPTLSGPWPAPSGAGGRGFVLHKQGLPGPVGPGSPTHGGRESAGARPSRGDDDKRLSRREQSRGDLWRRKRRAAFLLPKIGVPHLAACTAGGDHAPSHHICGRTGSSPARVAFLVVMTRRWRRFH